MLEEVVLVVRAAEGDPRAFEQLLRRHQQTMYTVALRILNHPDDAEDVTQNAFVAVWRRLPEFRRQAKFSTWLYRIVTNHALNVLRSRSRTGTQTDLAALLGSAEPVTSQPGPAQHAESSALLRDLRTALAGLPDELRVCWLLREVENKSYEEVAAIAGVSLDTARGRVYRARHRLAEAMAAWR